MVKFNTVSGNAALETDGDVTSPPPAPTAPGPAPKAATSAEALSTREILDQIAEGKLTVDEGLNLIKGE